MKVIFLDIDGVLNFSGCKERLGSIFFVNDEKIKILKEIIDKTNAKIVLSSTWRYGWHDLDNGDNNSVNAKEFLALKEKLLEFDIELFDKTKSINGNRPEEIIEWLSRRDDVENILILDDKYSMQPLNKFFLQTSFREGLKPAHIKHAIEMLEGQKFIEYIEKQKYKEEER